MYIYAVDYKLGLINNDILNKVPGTCEVDGLDEGAAACSGPVHQHSSGNDTAYSTSL